MPPAPTGVALCHANAADALLRPRPSPPPHACLQITNVVRNAAAITQVIGPGETFEKQLRAAFGNTPDTSKALRM